MPRKRSILWIGWNPGRCFFLLVNVVYFLKYIIFIYRFYRSNICIQYIFKFYDSLTILQIFGL